MDLWIRSQTKIGLIKTNDIYIRSVLHKKDINDKGKSVWQILANNEIVAEYCTKERALEVIREIQNLLMSQDKLLISTEVLDYEYGESIYNHIKNKGWLLVDDNKNESVKYITPNTIVYEMPKE